MLFLRRSNDTATMSKLRFKAILDSQKRNRIQIEEIGRRSELFVRSAAGADWRQDLFAPAVADSHRKAAAERRALHGEWSGTIAGHAVQSPPPPRREPQEALGAQGRPATAV